MKINYKANKCEKLLLKADFILSEVEPLQRAEGCPSPPPSCSPPPCWPSWRPPPWPVGPSLSQVEPAFVRHNHVGPFNG